MRPCRPHTPARTLSGSSSASVDARLTCMRARSTSAMTFRCLGRETRVARVRLMRKRFG